MEGKIVIITGSSAGIGKENAFELLKNGATIIFACRDEKKTMKVIEKTKEIPQGQYKTSAFERSIFMKLELTSFESVKNFAKELKAKFNKVDILLNNAGYVTMNYNLTKDNLEAMIQTTTTPMSFLLNNAGYVTMTYNLTKDNLEAMIQTNHHSHVLLTYLLLDVFDKTEARVINVSSIGHSFSNYDTKLKEEFGVGKDQYKKEIEGSLPNKFVAYGNSKLANIYFSQYLAEKSNFDKRFSNIVSYSLHPGAVDSEFSRFSDESSIFLRIFMWVARPLLWFGSKTENDGAQTQLRMCYDKKENLKNGGYYKDLVDGPLSKNAQNKEIRDLVMEQTMKDIAQHLE
eukprot:CAMPEP_0170535852 /NCGR_PEP_ID=MMETSP0209-20121228/101829_1 /TAXON_ID=665100 ORGANISM="Litonotus pictus, Strain P1" /NCGR_SAMPLE_ID=MMETSP0209 /ASSEMBLY_ACC=CAM_ASM_000301 /LENGTH=343 /DNA_ID=CAMNT_0010837159 /DNA_START=97 /DNA_END=1129 /DNA_ORIENTATION=-